MARIVITSDAIGCIHRLNFFMGEQRQINWTATTQFLRLENTLYFSEFTDQQVTNAWQFHRQ